MRAGLRGWAGAAALLVAACADHTPGAKTSEHLAAGRHRADMPVEQVTFKSERARLRALLRAHEAAAQPAGPDPGNVHASYHVDVQALPILPEPTELTPAELSVGAFDILLGEDARSTLRAHGDWIAEVNVGRFRGFHPGGTPAQSFGARPRGNVPPTRIVCSDVGRDAPATLEGFRTVGWFKESLSYARLEGSFDPAACRGAVTRGARVRAPALVPGLVYAFRERSARGLDLVVVGPPADWVATSALTAPEQNDPRVGTFTRLKIPLERGRASAALMNVSAPALATFLRLRGDQVDWPTHPMSVGVPVISFTVDVVWPADAEEPEARAFAVAIEPGGEQVLDWLRVDGSPGL